MKLAMTLAADQRGEAAKPEEISIETCQSAQWPELRPIWVAMAENSPHTSFFLSAEWVDCWLEHYSSGLDVSVLTFRCDNVPVGICLLVGKKIWRGPFPWRKLYLNATGENEADGACLEFNNLVTLPDWDEAVAERLALHIAQMGWDEFVLNGFCRGKARDALCRHFEASRLLIRDRPSYYVDLDSVRASGLTYEETLGQTTRKHLRQNYRNYGKSGEIITRTAGSVDEALSWLEELAVLHQHSWNSRGKPGVFASRRFSDFHHALIRHTFYSGGTQLFKVSNSDVIGLLYVFLYRGKVYFYQSGFDYRDDKRLSPGTVTNACAINFCLESGLKEFDFLASDAQYKKSLSTGCRTLEWIRVQRKGWKLHAIEFLTAIRRRTLPNTGLQPK